MPKINPGIFREYDIRGIVDSDLDEEVLNLIGKSFGTHLRKLGKSRISIGRDCRESSPLFSDAFADGLNSCGINVLDIGMVSTPILYFSLFNLDVDGGVMITASHNPSEYNGIKLCAGKESLFGEQIQQIRILAEKREFASGSGRTEKVDLIDRYRNYMMDNINIKPGLRVGVDCGNGMGGLLGPSIIRNHGCEVFELFSEPDGRFPNHHPDPTVEKNLKDLIQSVRDNKLDIGIGFDGDADRIGVVDENGDIIWGDMILLMLSREVLKVVRGAEIIGDVKCSGRLFRDIEKNGGKPKKIWFLAGATN